jgi:hypothetical protein
VLKAQGTKARAVFFTSRCRLTSLDQANIVGPAGFSAGLPSGQGRTISTQILVVWKGLGALVIFQ